MDQLAKVIDQARRQLFPTLYTKLPPKSEHGSNKSVNVALVDAARTTVCVVGDTFEAFALIQGFLDRGVPPDSLVLLIPQDPNADVDVDDERQNAEIEYLMQPPGYCKFKPQRGCHVPAILG